MARLCSRATAPGSAAYSSIFYYFNFNDFFSPLSKLLHNSMAQSFPGNAPSIQNEKLIYPAATRNREPILEVFKKYLPTYFKSLENLFFLEISSGSGQHVAHFAPNFPQITFQPSEYSEETIGSIGIYANECPTKNIKKPILIDVMNDLGMYGFEKDSIDIIYNCNMIHVAPYECTTALFRNAGAYLKPSGVMMTYGPYAVNGIISPESNVNFDKSLKLQNPLWGIRCIDKIQDIAINYGIILKEIVDMPANNKCLLWQKDVK